MGSIRSSIELQDNFTAIMMNVITAVNTSISTMEQMQAVMSDPIDTASLDGVRDNINQATMAVQELEAVLQDIDDPIRDNVEEQRRFNDEIRDGTDSAADLKNMISSAVGAFVGVAGLRKAKSWIEDCTAAFNTQLNAETQLINVLANMLDEDYVAQFEAEIEVSADTTAAVSEINAIQGGIDEINVPVTAETKALTAAYNQITAKASEIQSRGIYGDEAMIAAAAEFSTYFTDTDAIEMMMDTLANYAMGMSGGGEIDSTGMVDYATNLGKIMSGAYDAMTKKGFEFTDAQKAIIEGEATREQIIAALGEEYLDMTADMQAAAAITQVIDEAWAGLYENMSNTPQGKIIQLTNAFGDMKEVVGRQLYPYVIRFVDAITENRSTIEKVVQGITTGLKYMLGIMSWLMEGAINFAQVVMDNWSWISPIIYGVAGALAVYYGWLVITKGAALALAKAQAILTGVKILAVPIYAALTGATIAETAAQWGLNAALYDSPIVWIIILIIALIALFYAAVAIVNKFAGTSVSATGIIAGVFSVLFAFIANSIIIPLWNLFATFVNFIGNAFNDPVAAIKVAFYDMCLKVIGYIQNLASAIENLINKIPGVEIDITSGLGSFYSQLEQAQQAVKNEAGWVEYVGKKEFIDYDAAWNAGYSFGEGVDESIANFGPASLFETIDIPSAEDYAIALANGSIGTGIDDVAGNTGAMADAMDITGEELKYLRDIAEQEAINRFTTAEINIEQTNHNTIKNGMDLDGVVSGLTDAVNEAIEISTEGVHD